MNETPTGRYVTKPNFTVVEVELVRTRKGFWVRPNTSDKNMLKEGMSDYPTVNCKGKRVMDLGANIGGFTYRARMEGATQVTAYEPDEFNFEMLERNMSYDYYDNVELIRAAVIAGAEKELTFFMNDSGNSACSGSILNTGHRRGYQVTVPAVNFQEDLEIVKPELIKMDVEGAEYSLLEQPLPDYVKELAIEIHGMTNEMRAKMKDLLAHLVAQFGTVLYEKHITVFNRPSIILAHLSRM